MQVGSVVVYAARRAHRGCAPPASPRPAPTAGRRPSMAGCPHTPCARDGLWRGPASGKIEGNSNSNNSSTSTAPQQTAPATPASAAGRQRSRRQPRQGVARPSREGIGQSGFDVFPDRGKGSARCGRRGDDQSRPWMAGGRKWEQDSADSGWASPLRPRRAAAARKTPTRTFPPIGRRTKKKPRPPGEPRLRACLIPWREVGGPQSRLFGESSPANAPSLRSAASTPAP